MGEGPPIKTGCNPCTNSSSSRTRAYPSAVQFLRALLVADHDRAYGLVQLVEEGCLLLTLPVRDVDPPLQGLRVHPEMTHELQVLLLNVLGGMGRDTGVREEPVEITGPGHIEAQLGSSGKEARDDAGFEVDLKCEHQIEASLFYEVAELGEVGPCSAASALATVYEQLVDGGMAVYESTRDGLDDP